MTNEVAMHVPCTINDTCSSSDGMVIYDNEREDGKLLAQCFSCGSNKHITPDEVTVPLHEPKPVNTDWWSKKQKWTISAIPDRRLSQEATRFYNIGVLKNTKGEVTHHLYPHYDAATGKRVGSKIRIVSPKNFFFEGQTKNLELFGQRLFTPNPRQLLTITEGHVDAVAGWQMQKKMSGYSNPWVAMQSSNDIQSIRDNYKWLSGWKGIVLMLDNDAAGQKYVDEICSMFDAGYVRKFQHKAGFSDASDYLMAGEARTLQDQWFKATEHRPEGVVMGSDNDFRKSLRDYTMTEGVPYPYKSWNERTYGIRKGELVILGARRGTGKTTNEYAIIEKIHQELPDAKIGTFFLEDTKVKTGLGLVGLAANLPLHVPDVEYSDEQWNAAYDRILADDRIFMFDHCGVMDIETIEKYIRYFVKVQGVEYIILDHLGRVRVPELRNDERKALDEVGIRLSALAVELNIAIIASAHMNREGNVRGSDGPENNASVMIIMEKVDADGENPRMTKVTVTKNREYGWLEGECDPLVMDTSTGRLYELQNYNATADEITSMVEDERS